MGIFFPGKSNIHTHEEERESPINNDVWRRGHHPTTIQVPPVEIRAYFISKKGRNV